MAEKKINGREYQISYVLATTAVRHQMRLLKIIGKGSTDKIQKILGVALDARKTGVDNLSEADREKFLGMAVEVFTEIVGNSDPEEITRFIKDTVELARIRSSGGIYETIDMDSVFSKDQKSIIPVTVWVLGVVLRDFFSELPGSGGPDPQAEKSAGLN